LPDTLSTDELLALAADVLDIEARAVDALKSRLGDNFIAACQLCMDTPGRIVVTGMGKSGHVSNKIAATLASGDLGMLTSQDLLLAISYSGETAEVVTILPLVKRMGAKLLSITGNPRSTMAQAADVHLDISVEEEACPLNLAPTASTTATLAMGDALAVALLQMRGFTAEDFARSHPSGSLGKRLLLRVSDVMRTGDRIPTVTADVPLRDALLEMTDKGLGMTAIIDADDKILGIYTDGDLRRTLDTGADIRTTLIRDVITRSSGH
jgi:arabinose-5-phosphate isomerase